MIVNTRRKRAGRGSWKYLLKKKNGRAKAMKWLHKYGSNRHAHVRMRRENNMQTMIFKFIIDVNILGCYHTSDNFVCLFRFKLFSPHYFYLKKLMTSAIYQKLFNHISIPIEIRHVHAEQCCHVNCRAWCWVRCVRQGGKNHKSGAADVEFAFCQAINRFMYWRFYVL